MLNFPKILKIALRKISELSHSLWRSKRDFRVKLTFFWVALHIRAIPVKNPPHIRIPPLLKADF